MVKDKLVFGKKKDLHFWMVWFFIKFRYKILL